METPVLRLADLRREITVELRPDAAAREAIAGRLGLLALKKLSFTGKLLPEGRADWRLEADLGATVVQPCVVTLEPVTTRIDEAVTRRYLAESDEPAPGSEAEMPQDDTAEPLPETLDLAEVMEEALALALPAWPRAEGVELGALAVTEPGRKPLTDEDVKPFAALGELRRKLAEDGDPEA